MFSPINISRILLAHFSSLREDYKGWIVLTNFLLIPATVSGILYALEVTISSDTLKTFLMSTSVVAGLLFNVVFVIFNIGKGDDIKKSSVKSLLKHLYANTLYCLLLSVAIIGMSILGSLLLSDTSSQAIKVVVSTLFYLVIVHFGANILMVIKRMYTLLDAHFEEDGG